MLKCIIIIIYIYMHVSQSILHLVTEQEGNNNYVQMCKANIWTKLWNHCVFLKKINESSLIYS